MKISCNFKLPIISLLLLISVVSFAQKDFQGKAFYFSKTTMDMSNFGDGRQLSEQQKKQIAERMKSALEKNFILTFNQSESSYKEEERLESPGGQGGGGRFSMMSSSGGTQYKNIKNQKVFKEQEFFGKQFLVNDSLQKLEWQLGTETKMIGQYMCFKATAVKIDDSFDFSSFRRRPSDEKPKDSTSTENKDVKEAEMPKTVIVTAWYAPQIPVSQGPDVYWGLPGLILEVNADRTTILCSKIVLNPTEKDAIEVPTKGKEVTQKEYDIIVKEKMEEMREMFRSRGGGRGHD
jgi:GLPGLI family protein